MAKYISGDWHLTEKYLSFYLDDYLSNNFIWQITESSK